MTDIEKSRLTGLAENMKSVTERKYQLKLSICVKESEEKTSSNAEENEENRK